MGILWQGLDESPPQCVSMLKAVLTPVLQDLTATAPFVELVIDPRPRTRCGFVLLPYGRSWADVTSGAMAGGPFPPYGGIEIKPKEARGITVAVAAGSVQQFAIAAIWETTGVGGWPLCPEHQTHPLWPYPSSDSAVWRCERSGYEVEIGDLRKQ